MSVLSVSTDCLNLADSKLILEHLHKPGPKGQWEDWSGLGGVEVEFKSNNVPREQLSSFVLPAYCPTFYIEFKDDERGKSQADRLQLLGGNDWMPPEYGGQNEVQFLIGDPVLHWPVFVAFRKRNDWKYYGRQVTESVRVWVYLLDAKGDQPVARVSQMKCGPPPTIDGALKFFKDLTEVYSLPDQNSKGLLETRSNLAPPGRLVYENDFEMSMFEGLRSSFENMISKMIRESRSDYHSLNAFSDLGCAAWFEGKMSNVRDDAMVLLSQIAQENSFPHYDITYQSLGPRDWRDREKSRKKWKKPIHEELGTGTLENGVVVSVSLCIQKEGYIFTLKFGSDEDCSKFKDSKLFKQTQWHSGAE